MDRDIVKGNNIREIIDQLDLGNKWVYRVVTEYGVQCYNGDRFDGFCYKDQIYQSLYGYVKPINIIMSLNNRTVEFVISDDDYNRIQMKDTFKGKDHVIYEVEDA